MQATGVICAVLDCDADSIEAFNRWYDLEHVPPNVSLDGVMSLRFAGGDGDQLDLVFLEGDVAERTAAIRAAAPHHPDATVVVRTTSNLGALTV